MTLMTRDQVESSKYSRALLNINVFVAFRRLCHDGVPERLNGAEEGVLAARSRTFTFAEEIRLNSRSTAVGVDSGLAWCSRIFTTDFNH